MWSFVNLALNKDGRGRIAVEAGGGLCLQRVWAHAEALGAFALDRTQPTF
jgi:hypothetical protein